jgi:hypothetical protein
MGFAPLAGLLGKSADAGLKPGTTKSERRLGDSIVSGNKTGCSDAE